MGQKLGKISGIFGSLRYKKLGTVADSLLFQYSTFFIIVCTVKLFYIDISYLVHQCFATLAILRCMANEHCMLEYSGS